MTALHALNRFVLIPLCKRALQHTCDHGATRPQWHRLWTGKHHAGTWCIVKCTTWQAGPVPIGDQP